MTEGSVNQMNLSLIVAVSENNVIGHDGDMPWRLSTDLKWFRRKTMGHHLVMGRRTYETFAGELPGRTMLVLTRQNDYHAAHGKVVASLDEAFETAAGDDEVFISGGEEIYRMALQRSTAPQIQTLYLTRVHATVEGDTFFPEIDFSQWKQVETTFHDADEKNDYACTFEVWQRATLAAET